MSTPLLSPPPQSFCFKLLKLSAYGKSLYLCNRNSTLFGGVTKYQLLGCSLNILGQILNGKKGRLWQCNFCKPTFVTNEQSFLPCHSSVFFFKLSLFNFFIFSNNNIFIGNLSRNNISFFLQEISQLVTQCDKVFWK